jgi:hypothetical protein
MKSIKQQYIDLIEGKMSQANFMRNIRITIPQYITNVTSFSDSIKILKNKGILTEAVIDSNDEELETLPKGGEFMNDENDEDDEIMAFLDKLEQEKAGEEAVMAQHDINEAKERKGSSGKEQYSKFTDPQKDNIQELTLGIKFEHECFREKTYDEIVKIVLKNIKKEPLYYTYFKLTGVRDYKPESMDKTNTPEVMAMKPVKDGNLVDQKRGMKKVKIVK